MNIRQMHPKLELQDNGWYRLTLQFQIDTEQDEVSLHDVLVGCMELLPYMTFEVNQKERE